MTQELKGKCYIVGLSSNVIINIHKLNKYQSLTMEIKGLLLLLKVVVRNLGIIPLRRFYFFYDEIDVHYIWYQSQDYNTWTLNTVKVFT
jgi:hypothetical protein